MEKIGCFIYTVSNDEMSNFKNDTFFGPNAVNSFKTYHPDIDLIYITDDNLQEYLTELNITEYYDNLGILRIHIIKELMLQQHYTKMIMLGADTFTCARLDEFLEPTSSDMICSLGPPYPFLKTEYWAPTVKSYTANNKTYHEVDFINADVVCFNNSKIVEILYEKSLEYWTDHCEQGGMNYLYQNQDSLNIKVSIVDYPYFSSKVAYNVRSKGEASGGCQMKDGNLYSGHYNDSNSKVISQTYPTSEYIVKNNKLYTPEGKQIKAFHYAEALAIKTKSEYDEVISEIKTLWFNTQTKEFLINKCNCKF